MTTIKVDVASLMDDPGGVLVVEDVYDVNELVVGEERFVLRAPAQFRVALSNTGGALIASGTVSADVTAECSRCLKEFPLTLTAEVEAFYVRHGDEREIPEEQDFAYVEASEIDLAPAVEAALAVEAPFAPLHDEDCPGLCPVCGADLGEGECGCAPPMAKDSPFEALSGMFEDEPADEG